MTLYSIVFEGGRGQEGEGGGEGGGGRKRAGALAMMELPLLTALHEAACWVGSSGDIWLAYTVQGPTAVTFPWTVSHASYLCQTSSLQTGSSVITYGHKQVETGLCASVAYIVGCHD